MSLLEDLLENKNKHHGRHEWHKEEEHHREHDNHDNYNNYRYKGGHSEHSLDKYLPLLKHYLAKPYVIISLGLAIILGMVLLVAAVVFVLPGLINVGSSLGNSVTENGVKGIVDSLISQIEKLWFGTGK